VTQLLLFDADILGGLLDEAARTPCLEVELDPTDAEALAAFEEEALSADDAADGTLDLFEGLP
jgi:hypothetical protein